MCSHCSYEPAIKIRVQMLFHTTDGFISSTTLNLDLYGFSGLWGSYVFNRLSWYVGRKHSQFSFLNFSARGNISLDENGACTHNCLNITYSYKHDNVDEEKICAEKSGHTRQIFDYTCCRSTKFGLRNTKTSLLQKEKTFTYVLQNETQDFRSIVQAGLLYYSWHYWRNHNQRWIPKNHSAWHYSLWFGQFHIRSLRIGRRISNVPKSLQRH